VGRPPLGVADLLSEPIRRVLPPTIVPLLPAGPAATLLEILTGKRALHSVRRDFIGEDLIAIAENRRTLAQRQADHPRAPGTADADPLGAFREAVSAARAVLGDGDNRIRGHVVGVVSILDDPARLTYEESTGARDSGGLVRVGPATVQIGDPARSVT
jgi:hypothetical protein